MKFEMYAKVRMNRPIDNSKDCISAGGYSFLSNRILYPFDFYEYSIEIDKDDASIVHINGSDLDYDTFPLAESITEDVLKNISDITEFFIYTGEPGEDCANPVELIECIFYISDNGKKIIVPEDICKGAYVTRGF